MNVNIYKYFVLIFLCIIFGSLKLPAQQDITYDELLKQYNHNLSVVNPLLNLNQDDARIIHSINDELYYKLLDLDTVNGKVFLHDQIVFLDSFSVLLKSQSIQEREKIGLIHSYLLNIQWYQQQGLHSGLETCSACFLIRKVRITVLGRKQDYSLDTLPCINVSYQKIFSGNTGGASKSLSSFPCPEDVQVLSTGPSYHFSFNYKGKTVTISKEVNIGSAETDIQDISLVIDAVLNNKK